MTVTSQLPAPMMGRKAHPDEKGTESARLKVRADGSYYCVAKHIPMRRELKVESEEAAKARVLLESQSTSR